jgi:hypothetical protein
MASVVAEIWYSAVYLPSLGLALQALLMGSVFRRRQRDRPMQQSQALNPFANALP